MIELNEVKPGSVILAHGKVAIVVEVSNSRPKNPIAYKNNTEHRGYICGLQDVQAVLAYEGSLEAFKNVAGEAPKLPSRNDGTDLDFLVPDQLKGVKIGDEIMFRHGRGGSKKVVYKGYKSSRPKYPISYEYNGKPWKGTLSGFVSKVA